MDSRLKQLEDIKYEYERMARYRDSLQKNIDRRKKLNLVDDSEEDSVKSELEDLKYKMDDMRRRIRSLESESTRARVISESGEKSPWEK